MNVTFSDYIFAIIVVFIIFSMFIFQAQHQNRQLLDIIHQYEQTTDKLLQANQRGINTLDQCREALELKLR